MKWRARPWALTPSDSGFRHKQTLILRFRIFVYLRAPLEALGRVVCPLAAQLLAAQQR